MTMARFRNLHPVRSIKHIIDIQGGLVAAATTVNTLVAATDTPTLADVDGVETGATVNAIFLNVQVQAIEADALANVYMAVYKDPGGDIGTIAPDSVGANANKKQVIHQEMLMTEPGSATTGIPRTIFKDVIKIPRGYKRFGYEDKLRITLKSPGVNYNFCLQCIYKEFR